MLDVRGGLKNTKMSRHPLAVLEELTSNSIDSFLIREANSQEAVNFDLTIKVTLTQRDLHGDDIEPILEVVDNGNGYDERAIEAFVTKDTTYKDDLQIAGIQQCKGSGRIQYFHVFERLSIDSVSQSQGGIEHVTLNFAEGQKTISRSDFVHHEINGNSEANVATRTILSEMRPQAHERLSEFGSMREVFSAENIKRFLLSTFLQRLIGLSATLGAFRVSIVVTEGDFVAETSFVSADLPALTEEREFEVREHASDTGIELPTSKKFKLTYYRIDADEIDLAKNAISLCAKSTPVVDLTNRYLRTKAQENNQLGGAYHIIFVESDELDRKVNEQRDGFDDLPETIPSGDLFSKSTISESAIFEQLDEIVGELVAPPDWDKEQVINSASSDFGISEEMLAHTDTRIRYGDSPRSVAKRVLKKYQDKIVQDTAEIVDLYHEVAQLTPDAPDFREKINKLSWTYTASVKSFDMANLSQLVVRRTAIVKALELACKRLLICQDVEPGERRKDERLIHHIFFPMQATTTEDAVEHDIWLLSEEYQYYDYIVSDRPLSAIELPSGKPYFDTDIDDALKKILNRRSEENAGKRPDIALFTQEGAAVIVEFKAPGVSMDNHVGDIYEYAYLLNAKSKGRLKKFYAYLIGDTLNPIRLTGSWNEFADGGGYFLTDTLSNPETREKLGEIYSEILYYEDVTEKAKKRIKVYQDKLGLRA